MLVPPQEMYSSCRESHAATGTVHTGIFWAINQLAKILILGVALGCISSVQAADKIDAVARAFAAEGVVGTFVVESADGNIRHVHNPERAKQRFSPASTFKIPNTLIALNAAVVSSVDSGFKWDGTVRDIRAWNRDQTLQSAFNVSCVWCYQEIALQVGNSAYRDDLARMDYGNRNIGDHVDQFWLNGDLQISANEQIKFLRELHNYSFPYERQHIDIVKTIMLTEQSADYALYAKTGWTGPERHIGWYVGYVETDDQTWFFAMNMRMDRADQAALRKGMTIKAFQALQIL